MTLEGQRPNAGSRLETRANQNRCNGNRRNVHSMGKQVYVRSMGPNSTTQNWERAIKLNTGRAEETGRDEWCDDEWSPQSNVDSNYIASRIGWMVKWIWTHYIVKGMQFRTCPQWSWLCALYKVVNMLAGLGHTHSGIMMEVMCPIKKYVGWFGTLPQ